MTKEDLIIDETKESDINKRNIAKLRNKSDIIKKVDNIGLNTYKVNITAGTTDIGLGSDASKERYSRLLEGKISDKRLEEDIILHSRTLIKNRITMKLVLSDTRKSLSGILNIVGIVPEDQNEIRDFFIGRTIGSNDWYVLIQEFQNYMSEIGKPIVRAYSEIVPSEVITVDLITIRATFK